VLGLYVTDEGPGLTWDRARPVYPEREERMLRWEGSRGAEAIRDRWRRLFALLPAIEKAELRIGRVLLHAAARRRAARSSPRTTWSPDGGWPAPATPSHV
jgi:hypothetical protein